MNHKSGVLYYDNIFYCTFKGLKDSILNRQTFIFLKLKLKNMNKATRKPLLTLFGKL